MGASVAGANSSALALTAVPIGCSGAVFSAVASNGVSPDATSNGADAHGQPGARRRASRSQPSDVSVVAPATATFTAAAAGVPSPTVQWQQSTDAGATWANITGATEYELHHARDRARRQRQALPRGVHQRLGQRQQQRGDADGDCGAAIGRVQHAGRRRGRRRGQRLRRRHRATTRSARSRRRASPARWPVWPAAPAPPTARGSAARFERPARDRGRRRGQPSTSPTPANETIRMITPAGVVTTLAGLAGHRRQRRRHGQCGPLQRPVRRRGRCGRHGLRRRHVQPHDPHGSRRPVSSRTLAGLAGTPPAASTARAVPPRFATPRAIAVDAAGNLYVAELSHTIRKITPAGVVSTLAGSGQDAVGSADGTGSAARFADPRGVAVDAAGNVYVSDTAEPHDPPDHAGRCRHDAGRPGGRDGQRRRHGQCGPVRQPAGRRRSMPRQRLCRRHRQRLDPKGHARRCRHDVRAVTGRAAAAHRPRRSHEIDVAEAPASGRPARPGRPRPRRGRRRPSDGPADRRRDPRRGEHPAAAAARRSPARSSRASSCASRPRTRCSASRGGAADRAGDRLLSPEQAAASRATVNLSAGTFTPPVLIPLSEGQLGLTITEVSDFSFVFQDPAFLHALALRGIAHAAAAAEGLRHAADAGLVRPARGSAPHRQGADVLHRGRRHQPLRAADRGPAGDHRPRRAPRSSSCSTAASCRSRRRTHNFDEASVGARVGLRPELKPIRISQPLGRNFRIDGNFIEWQKWRFHARFERRSGPVISLVTYDRRQVMYQGSLAEIFVPYQDPGANWFYRTYMDAGEFGFGLLASPLAPGARRARERGAARRAWSPRRFPIRACRWCRCRCRA